MLMTNVPGMIGAFSPNTQPRFHPSRCHSQSPLRFCTCSPGPPCARMVKHSKSSYKQRRNDVIASLTGVRSDAWIFLLDLVGWDSGVMQHAHDRGWVLDLKQISFDHYSRRGESLYRRKNLLADPKPGRRAGRVIVPASIGRYWDEQLVLLESI